MRKMFRVLILLIAANLPAFAQKFQKPDFLTVKTEKGIMVVNNNKTQPFAFLVAGKDVAGQRSGDDGLAFFADGKTLYVYFIPASQISTGKKEPNLAEVLYAHRRTELENLGKSWNFELAVDDDAFLFLNTPEGQSFGSLFWSYPRPAGQNAESSRDAFQTTLIGDMILMLGAPLKPGDNIADVRQLLNGTLSSLYLLPGQMQTPLTKDKAPAPAAKAAAPKTLPVKPRPIKKSTKRH